MNPTTLGYIGFVVAMLILTWAAIELGRRLGNYRKGGNGAVNRWVRLDATHADTEEDFPPIADQEDQENTPEQKSRTRAQQNGHYSESKTSS